MTTTADLAVRRPPYQQDFPAEELAARRRRLAEAIGSGAVAVLQGAAATAGFDPFRQSNEFYYLTGIEVPGAYLLIVGGSGEATLYLPPQNEKHERSEGESLCLLDAALVGSLTGVEFVRPREALAEDLAGCRVLLTLLAPAEVRQVTRDAAQAKRSERESDPWDRSGTREERFRHRLEALLPNAEVRDLTPHLDGLRLVKSAREIELMREAGRQSAHAVREAMRCTRPGMREYELAAVAECLFLSSGSRGSAYATIVAGGANIWHAHYFRNDAPLEENELVLMDGAPDFHYYTSDIGRMWPVNGTYSPEQRELYGFVVDYHKALLQRIRPGATPEQILQETADVMRPVIEQTDWSRESLAAAARDMLEYAGHLSHPVGMAVHDPGNYRRQPLVPGLVFAVDPQLWVREEQIYIRVEDTVVVTDTGIEVLTSAAPLELDDVERVMQQSSPLTGIGQRIEQQGS